MAIRPGEAKPLWRVPSRAPYVSSPLVHDGLLYLAGERGRVFCCDAKTGELVWVEQTGKAFWSSPVYADGHVYLLAEDGETFVLKAGRKYEVVARNKLGEDTLGSPAISGGKIFIRTAKQLFCIGGE
jgi:outer membrane protein assembly factor BamB